MGGTELVYNLFAECREGFSHSGLCVVDPSSIQHVWPVLQAIFTAMVVKTLLTIVTFGIKVPAGIFIPTLGVGACAGRIMGTVMHWLQLNYPDNSVFRVCRGDANCVVPGLYAMVGAAATLSGVTVRIIRAAEDDLFTLHTANHSFSCCHHVRAHGYLDLRCTNHAGRPRRQDSRRRAGTQGHIRPRHRVRFIALHDSCVD